MRLDALLLAAIAALAALCVTHDAAAHPFGLSSVNRYLGIECTERGGLHIAWLLDFA